MQTIYHGTAGNLLFVGGHPNPVPLPRDAEKRNWDVPPQTVAWPRVVDALGLTAEPAATQPIATAAATPTYELTGGLSTAPEQEKQADTEPDGLEAVNSMPLPDAAEWYTQKQGFAVLPCYPHDKKARVKQWSTPEVANRYKDPEVVRKNWQTHPNDNMGAILEPSGIITFDLDNAEITKKVFTAIGMEEVLSSTTAGIKSGKPNSAKLVFKTPTHFEGLRHRSLVIKVNGEDTTIFELRAGMMQDVLPPSIHPETHTTYQWVGYEPIIIQNPPTTLMALWVNWEKYKPALIAAAEGREIPDINAEPQPPAPRQPHKHTQYSHTGADVVEEWDRRHTLTTELIRYGYRPTSNPTRFDRPACKDSDGGVVIIGPDKFYVHNASDEFCDEAPHDCWDLYVRHEHNGDQAAALRAAEQELGWGTATKITAAGITGTMRPTPTDDEEDAAAAEPQHPPKDVVRPGTLDAYAELIAQRHSEFVTYTPLKDKQGNPAKDSDGNPLMSVKVNADKYARLWQDVSHLCGVMEGKDSYAYYDGSKFVIVPHSEGVAKAVNRCAHRTAELITAKGVTLTEEGTAKLVKQLRGTLDMLRDITAHRPGHTTVSIREDPYRKGQLLRDGLFIVRQDGTVETSGIDPAVDFWLSSGPASINDIIPDIDDPNMTLRDVLNKFPNFRKAVQACAPPEERGDEPCPHERWITSLCGVLTHYTQPDHIPLDSWFYGYDNGQGGSGKTTHLTKIAEAFGGYVLNGVSWSVLTGQQMFNGSWLGKVGIICQEAGVHMIEDAEAIKCRTSGGWSLREMHMSEVTISQPLCMITAGNTKPLFKQTANGRPIWQRLIPIEWSQELRTGNEAFPCSDDEYYRAVLNIGIWQAIQLMRDGGRRKKRALAYVVTENEVRDLLQFAPYEDIIAEACKCVPNGKDVAVSELYELVLRELAERGVENPKAIPSLRTEKAFRADLVRQGIPNVSIDAYGNSRTLGKVYVRIVRPNSEYTFWVVGLEWRNPDGHAKHPAARK